MNQVEYLISLKNGKLEQVRDTWQALGGLECSNETKIYYKGAIYKINNPDSELDGALIFCDKEYKVDSENKPIEWETIQGLDVDKGIVSFGSGIQSTVFKEVMTAEELDSVKTIEVNKDFIPFSDYKADVAGVDIPDSEFTILMSELGVPFIHLEELEYNKKQIIDVFIKPMIELYFDYFPHVEQEYIGNYGANQEFQIPMPEGAFSAIPYYTVGAAGGMSGGNTFGGGAFNYMKTEMAYGGGGLMGGANRWGTMRYRKPVPGFTGGNYGDYMSMAFNQMAANQGMYNLFRREAFQKKLINGKWYITGFTTQGGQLNVKWLKCPYSWNMIQFDDLRDVRKLCTGNILTNFGMLRSMVKTDVPGAIDFSLFTQRGEKLMQEVEEKWKDSSTSYMHALLRGGV